ncbi:heterodisulfide reductase-related iron-sulfur binding cluster [Limnobacter sp.]|uniref:heterodisulfide reductase-related iron-sulfur binding cluster n=1 Tax=Limnobacter sp. TaxID=2003368 RepID=UPI00311F8B1B
MAQALVEDSGHDTLGQSVGWTSPDYFNEQECLSSMERVFEVCATCRLCLSQCNTFPSLFDLIDESEDSELGSVPKSRYLDLADQCHLCDQCHLGHCPYSAPHPQQIDFPATMLRAKAIKFAKGSIGHASAAGRHHPFSHLAGVPVVAALANTVVGSSVARKLIERSTGIDAQAWLPKLAKQTFLAQERALILAHPTQAPVVADHSLVPRQVAIYAGCYINLHEPEIGQDLIQVLQHNDIECVIANLEGCCGQAKLTMGDISGFAAVARANIPSLLALAESGYAIVSPSPSCARIFTHKLPALFPADTDIQRVKDAFWAPTEYLVALHGEGALRIDFVNTLGKVNYHEPFLGGAHLGIARHTETLLGLVPDTKVNVVKGSPGFGSHWGNQREDYPVAIKLGQRVFRQMAEPADYLTTDCQLTGRQIAWGIEILDLVQTSDKKPELAHPLTLLRMAYGL